MAVEQILPWIRVAVEKLGGETMSQRRGEGGRLWSPWTRHLQRTYSARETGVMQGPEKHNLTRITDAPAAFLIQLQRNFVRAFLVECSFDTA